MGLSIQKIREAASAIESHRVVHVPAWNGDVTIRRLSAADYLDIVESLKQLPRNDAGKVQLAGGENVQSFLADLVMRCATSDDGARLFAAEDRKLLTRDGTVLLLLGGAAMELNGLTGDAEKN